MCGPVLIFSLSDRIFLTVLTFAQNAPWRHIYRAATSADDILPVLWSHTRLQSDHVNWTWLSCFLGWKHRLFSAGNRRRSRMHLPFSAAVLVLLQCPTQLVIHAGVQWGSASQQQTSFYKNKLFLKCFPLQSVPPKLTPSSYQGNVRKAVMASLWEPAGYFSHYGTPKLTKAPRRPNPLF